MFKSRLFTVLAILAVAVNVRSSVVIDPEISQENRCGGPIEGDSGSITFPAAGQVMKPGEVCVWTIHLQTQATFRLNFSSLDIVSDRDDCGDGGVRLYSLTNLIPADRAESYTFCNQQLPPEGGFFLSGNLATVIYRSTHELGDAGTGFTLNFEGIAFEPIPKTHASTYTSAPSGIIREPIEGEYAPNQVNTWMIKSDVAPDLRLHLTFPYVDLESCTASPAEDCLCDALILYEVTGTGHLLENRRLCGQLDDVDIPVFGPNFILALFTDHQDVEGEGSGFELLYRPLSPSTSSTTTRPTTPDPSLNITTECGGVLSGARGVIEYKLNEAYGENERCVWTVRSEYASQIRFTVHEMHLERDYDFVTIYTFDATSIEDSYTYSDQFLTPRTVVLNGTVAVVIFTSDFSNSYSGFRLSFEGEGPIDDSVTSHYDFYSVEEGSNGLSLKYPESGLYANRELSTFVITRPNNWWRLIRFDFAAIDLELNNDNTCKDLLNIYYIDRYDEFRLRRLPLSDGFCQVSDASWNDYSFDTLILVLATDAGGQARGFELEWSTGPVP